jgi:hypothetical protein
MMGDKPMVIYSRLAYAGCDLDYSEYEVSNDPSKPINSHIVNGLAGLSHVCLK